MHGAVSMRTAYLRGENQIGGEPPAYDVAGRGGHLAALILDEIGRAPAAQFALPLPADRRLRILARRLIDDPGSRLDTNGWADAVGVSRRTLTRLFRAQTGPAFAARRCRLRLLRAAEHHAGGEPLVRAVARVGHNSVAAFQRWRAARQAWSSLICAMQIRGRAVCGHRAAPGNAATDPLIPQLTHRRQHHRGSSG
jgi:AraC-like DNA-binding protein